MQEERHTTLRRSLLQPNTLKMEPLPRTRVIITPNHIPVADPIAIAIPRRVLVVFLIISLHRGPFVISDLSGRQLRREARSFLVGPLRSVDVPGRSCSWFGEGRIDRG